ncbi:MAG: aspartate aminotransferase family protein [Thermomicrobiales bacterium]
MVQAPVKNTILSQYEVQFAGSMALYGRARNIIAGGIAHDGRYIKPFPLYVKRSQGGHKWDVDGHELIDFAMGHGALILGHGDPDVTGAVAAQLTNGTHYGAGHEAEIVWAEQISKLIPSAEQVRFVASGTEATLLAQRLARARTGKNVIVKFQGHFHGWNDYLIKGEKPPYDSQTIPGVPPEVLGTVVVLPANDPAMVEERLAQGDVAGVIIEPSGASWATIPLVDGFLESLRELTRKHGVVLIFDEVITGFRWSPGGAQARFNVTPDLTTLAKIVAGGLPGGAVAGRTEVLQHLAFKDEPDWNRKKVGHPGTFNANPLTATAGAVCLRKCADSTVQQHCDRLAASLRAGINAVFERQSVLGCAWGDSSVFHIILGEECRNRTAADLQIPEGISPEKLKASQKAGLATPLSLGMAIEGVDLFNGGGMFCVAHTQADVDHTIEAFDRVLTRMKDDGMVG